MKKKALIIGGLVLVGIGAAAYFFIYRKKGVSQTPPTPPIPPSPLGDSIIADTKGGKLMSKPSDKSVFIDYVAEQEVIIAKAEYAEGSWWYRVREVKTISDDTLRDGWMKSTDLINIFN